MRAFLFVFSFFSIFSFAFVTFISASTSYADEACYTPREAEAEQGIRIHSELMVIGLNCAHMANANGVDLYTEHEKFTTRHKDIFEEYENIMMKYFERNGAKNPEAEIHKMRTQVANKISNDVAKMRPDIFCKTYAKRIQKVSKMDGDTLRKWASTVFPEHPVSHQICETQVNKQVH